MLLWILVYSFFFSADFIDEVIILFGELTFWTTVVFATVVALAPRFLCKFIMSAYFPLDKEIVREAWVMGDLKDQLGIKHRKGKSRRAQNVSNNSLEAAPMFHQRTGSELSIHAPYEPTRASSPQPYVPVSLAAPYVDTPPTSRGLEVPGSAQDPSPHSLSPSPGPSSPQRGSYYSASDIPPPSPLPSPTYRYADGTITKTPPPPSRRGSVATTRASVPSSPVGPMPSPPLPPPHHDTLQTPSASGWRLSGGSQYANDPGSYEMRVRSPPLSSDGDHLHSNYGHGDRSASAASAVTFATANEEVWEQQYHHQAQPTQASQGYYPDDDQSRYSQVDDHRTSTMTWQGGRAF
ncbi:phospholipid transporting ATPase [Marasmius crinis-equi]|uniref:Phospholipid transporting ATPase n=1 Tax=Marasmius crinis-equi TaxID=585013 RepID=A0ABR3G0E0_9AGAR